LKTRKAFIVTIVFSLAIAFCTFSPAIELSPNLDLKNPLAVSDEVSRLITAGETCLAQGDYSSAYDAFKLALSLQAKNLDATVGLGDALAGLGKLAEAWQTYDSATKIDATKSSLWRKYADIVEKIGDDKQKEKLYISWAKSIASDAEPRHKLLDIYILRGDNGRIIDIGRELVGLGEYSNQLFITLGNAYLATNDDQKATETFNRLLNQDPNSVDAHMALGSLYLSKKLYNEASSEFEAALSINPNSNIAHYDLGVAYARLGESQPAIKELEQVCSPNLENQAKQDLGANYPRAFEELGTLYFQTGLYQEAVNILTRVRELQGVSSHSELVLAQALQALNRTSEAIDAYHSSISLDKNNASAYLGMGGLLLAGKEYAKAVEALKQSVAIDASNYQSQFLLGQAYLGNNDLSSAEKCFLKAQSLNSTQIESFVELGKIYTTQKNYPLAIQQLNGALGIKGNDPQVLFLLAEAYRSNGNAESAIEFYNKCLFVKDDFPEAHNSLGEVFYYQKDYSSAVVEFEQATRYNPNYALAFFNIGMTDEALGYYDPAISAYGSAYQLDGTMVKALLGKGRAQYLSGDLSGAETTLKQVASQDTANYEAHYYLGRIYDDSKKYSQAVQEYRSSSQLNPKHGDSFLRLGIALLFAKQDADAVTSLEEATRIMPDSVPAHSYLAVAYENTDQLQKALDEYKALAKLDPDNVEHQKDVAYLERELGDTNGAIDALTIAIKLDPADADLYLSRGDMYRIKAYNSKNNAQYSDELAWLKKAADDYEQFLSINPSSDMASMVTKFLDGYSRYKVLPESERRKVEVFPLHW
jgi:tetratricopeptide (TPR) repeat protein